MGFWGALGGSLGGGLASGLFSSHEARKNRRFQKMMADTAFQRKVNDMRAAGINPILGLGYQGAAVPSGAMGNIPDLSGSFSSAVQSSLAEKIGKANVSKVTAEASSAKVQAKFNEEMLDFMYKNPNWKNTIMGTMLLKKAGVPGWISAGVGYLSDLKRDVFGGKKEPSWRDKSFEEIAPGARRVK